MKTDYITYANYNFNGDTLDSSGNGYDLTVVGSVPEVNGHFGNGRDFSGSTSNYLEDQTGTPQNNFNYIHQTKTFTIECIFNTDGLISTRQTIVSTAVSSLSRGFLWWFNAGGQIEFYTMHGLGGVQWNTFSYSWTPTLNQYYYMVVTGDGTDYQLYIDGEEVVTYTTIYSGGGTGSQYGLQVGRYTVGSPLFGIVDSLRFSTQPRSAKEIREIYNKMKGVYALL